MKKTNNRNTSKNNHSEMLFSESYASRVYQKDIRNAAVTLILSGLLMIVIAGMSTIISIGAKEVAGFIFLAFGVILLLIGTFIPHKSVPIIKCFSEKFLSKIGILILKIILVPLYGICLLPFLLLRNKKKEFRFLTWDDKKLDLTSSFEEDIYDNKCKSGNVANSIFSSIFVHKMYILIPVVIILLILGLVFFFVSSSTVFSFIYTFI